MKTIEKFFKETRIKQGISKERISDLLGVSIEYIDKIESIESNEEHYSLSNIQSLMNVYNIDLLDLDIDLLNTEYVL